MTIRRFPLSRLAAALVAFCLNAGSARAASVTDDANLACEACARAIAGMEGDRAVGARRLCDRAAGAFARLRHWRDSFMSAPRYAELFPLVYWHVTRVELRKVADGAYAHPLEVLRQIDVFFDAYDWNRTRFEAGLPPETHWRTHFSAAANADQEFGQIGRGMVFDTPDTVDQVLGAGVLAHIDFDLPRSLRYAYAARLDQTLSPRPLADDFQKADSVFPLAATGGVADIEAAVRATSDWDPNLLRPEVMRWFSDIMERWKDEVLRHRHVAGMTGFGSGVLPTGDAAQPPPGPRPSITCAGGAGHD